MNGFYGVENRLNDSLQKTNKRLSDVSEVNGFYDLDGSIRSESSWKRIDDYFSFCERSGIRPGIETLCLSLHISRTTLFRWSNGIECSSDRQEIVQSAKSFIGAFIEQCMLGGKISPPSGIFLMKNWLNYKDTISFEESVPQEDKRRALTAAELPKLAYVHREDESESKLPTVSCNDNI